MTEPAKLYAARIVSGEIYAQVHCRDPKGKYVGECRYAHGELYRWTPVWLDDARLFVAYDDAVELELSVSKLEAGTFTFEIVCFREERP